MPVSEKFKEFFFYAGYAAVIATLVGFGYAMGLSATGYKQRVKDLEAQVQQDQKAQESTIAALARCQAESRSVDKQLNGDEEGRKLTVANGDTGEIKGHLNISVVGITTSRDPFSYVVSARFGAPGKETLSMPRLQVGDRISYNSYEIRLLAADLATARFGVREVGATGN